MILKLLSQLLIKKVGIEVQQFLQESFVSEITKQQHVEKRDIESCDHLLLPIDM